jgi:hypothetical protein
MKYFLVPALLGVLLLQSFPPAVASQPLNSSASKRARYQHQIEQELQEFTRKINVLKARVHKVSAEKSVELKQRIQLLEHKERAAKASFAQLKRSSGTQWEKIKKSVDRQIIDLRKTYNKTINKLH